MVLRAWFDIESWEISTNGFTTFQLSLLTKENHEKWCHLIYIKQPLGFAVEGYEHNVLKLKRDLYG